MGKQSKNSDGSPEEIARRNFTSRKKAKPWTDKEEEALAKAWIGVSEEPEAENPQQSDSFWKRVLENFGKQLGFTDRTVHQVNSKWKAMNKNIYKFNAVYNKLANCRSGQSHADILSATVIEYRKLYKNKACPHQMTWEIVKDNPKWKAALLTGPHVQTAKRTKTSDSSMMTTSSNAQFPNEEDEWSHDEEHQRSQLKGKKPESSSTSSEQQQQQPVNIVSEFNNFNKEDVDDKVEKPCLMKEDERFQYEEQEGSQRKGVKVKLASSSTSSEQQQLLKIVSEFNSFNQEDIEDKKRYRAEKLRLMKEEKEKKMLILEQELRMMQQKEKDKDMQFFLTPHDNLTGAALNAVLARKREIAQCWGWE